MDRAAALPVIPEYITVHLGPPDSNAQNVTVPFTYYIKNVASSEIYPTWNENAIRANIYAQISFALNRIYTEYYRARGYDFDITNSTTIDQSFIYGRDIFENISQIVDDIFNNYIVRDNFVEPLYALYCDGITATCDGLSQWGSEELANMGYTPYEILTYYYGDNINIVRDAPVENISASYPDVPLSVGSYGNDVRTIQTRLNRISANYPAIPKIAAVNGNFSDNTEDAVISFQKIFGLTQDGIVGKATWYKIQTIYNAVKRLNELESEGLQLADVEKTFTGESTPGDNDLQVAVIQYYLSTISDFSPYVQNVAIDGYYGESTRNAVLSFQREYGLPETGNVDEATWNRMASVYNGIVNSMMGSGIVSAEKFPGVFLNYGTSGENVEKIQRYLNVISDVYTEIPKLTVDGIFGANTQTAVETFQRLFGLPQNGVVGPFTWDLIAEKYNEIENGKLRSQFQSPGDSIS